MKAALKAGIVAYVPQAEEVDWNFPVLVEDVVMMGRYGQMNFLRMPRAADHAAVEAALERVEMTAFRKRQIGELSGGQRKRVFLARALAQDSRVILLDEPAAGVNPALLEVIMERVVALNAEGKSILLIEHNMDMVSRLCSRVVAMALGKLLAEGAPADVAANPAVIEAYLGGGA